MEESVLRLERYPTDMLDVIGGRASSPGDLASELFSQLHQYPAATIVLSHVPPYGYGDRSASFVSIGHKPLAVWLESRAIGPQGLVLCGHVHESFGINLVGDKPEGKTLVVNLAAGYALLDFTGSRWRIVHMQHMEYLVASQDLSDLDESE
jgi:Icc-related predicted phosphoesterase